jgi:hypothetical protein
VVHVRLRVKAERRMLTESKEELVEAAAATDVLPRAAER